MGQLEKKLKNKIRKNQIQHAVLASVAAAGLLTIAAFAPNALQMLKMFGFDSRKQKNKAVYSSRVRLVKAGLLQYENGFLHLTKKGEMRLRQFELLNFKLKKPKRWDKKWRVLIFDIPETKRKIRDKLRINLVQIGFARLQDSVWVYPYDCEDLVTFLKADFQIGKSLLYLIVDSIENDKRLKQSFGLKSDS